MVRRIQCFSDSVQVDRYWHTMHGNWTLQYGFAKPSEQSFKFEEGTDAAFHGFWLWPCTMLNVTSDQRDDDGHL